MDEMRIEAAEIIGAEAATAERCRPVGIEDDIGIGGKRPQGRPPFRGVQFGEGRVFAKTGVDHQGGDRRKTRAGDAHDRRAVLGHRATRHGAGDDAGEVQHAQAGKRPFAAWQ
ncbi:hypothetical protein GCM10023069_18310 [Shinella granuli]